MNRTAPAGTLSVSGRQHDAVNALLLYVHKAGGWRSASVLLRVYARWVPEWIETVAAAQPAATQAQPAAMARV